MAELHIVSVRRARVRFIGKNLSSGRLIVEDVNGNRRFALERITNDREIVLNLSPGIYTYFLIFKDREYSGRVVIN